jgi:hypothetical protein
MANELFVALYVYGDKLAIEVETPDLLTLFRLEPPPNPNEGWQTVEHGPFETGPLSLPNGVYGWFHDKPVTISVDGPYAVVGKDRGRGKDPWPKPPPPPPRFARHAARWDEHALGPDYFMQAIGDPPARTTTPAAPRRRATPAATARAAATARTARVTAKKIVDSLKAATRPRPPRKRAR